MGALVRNGLISFAIAIDSIMNFLLLRKYDRNITDFTFRRHNRFKTFLAVLYTFNVFIEIILIFSLKLNKIFTFARLLLKRFTDTVSPQS